jgi:hypothetical protein
MAGNTMFVTIKQAPSTFFAIAARLIPADVKVSIEQTFGELSAEDYPILQAIKAGYPRRQLMLAGRGVAVPARCAAQTEAKVIEA